MISIIIPVYNVEKYLRKCLDSILAQEYKDLEIVLVDDGSRDSSPKICKEYVAKDPRFVLIEKENEGAGIARNVGINAAHGEYIGFMDSDDYIEPFMYSGLFSHMIHHDADLVSCNLTDDSHDGINTDSYTEYGPERIKELIIGMIGTLPSETQDVLIGSSACKGLFKTSIIKGNNIKFKSERVIGSEDLVFNLEYLLCCQKVIVSDAVPYHYTVNVSSMTHTFGHFKYDIQLNLYRHIDSLMRTHGFTDYVLPLKRMFITRIRCGIINYAKACDIHNVKAAYLEIRDMLSDREVHEIISNYPGKQLPFKKRVFYYFMKKKNIIMCIVLGKGKR